MLDKVWFYLLFPLAVVFITLSVVGFYQDFKKDEYLIRFKCGESITNMYISRNTNFECN